VNVELGAGLPNQVLLLTSAPGMALGMALGMGIPHGGTTYRFGLASPTQLKTLFLTAAVEVQAAIGIEYERDPACQQVALLAGLPVSLQVDRLRRARAVSVVLATVLPGQELVLTANQRANLGVAIPQESATRRFELAVPARLESLHLTAAVQVQASVTVEYVPGDE
jgi:hypothetical protein